MFRLIKADLAATGKLHLRGGSPPCFLNCGAFNVLLREGGHFGFQVVAHEIEFVASTIFVGRVECGFRRRQGEDEPAMARIHGFKPEDIAKECAELLAIKSIALNRKTGRFEDLPCILL
jgi:hypothetical protein